MGKAQCGSTICNFYNTESLGFASYINGKPREKEGIEIIVVLDTKILS
jgi:hypothetical protein